MSRRRSRAKKRGRRGEPQQSFSSFRELSLDGSAVLDVPVEVSDERDESSWRRDDADDAEDWDDWDD